MILYIDTFVSETALFPSVKLENLLRKVQENSYAYRKQSKIDILKYSMASYAPIKWSKVIVRIDGELKEEIGKIRGFIEECFPGSDISFSRSDTGNKFADVLENHLEGNPWIFFSPNNDHPFIYKDPAFMERLLESAEKAEKKYHHPITILFSHFTENMNSIFPDRYLYGYTGDFCEIVDENEYSYTVKYDHVSLLSLQIYRAQYLYDMMRAAGNNRVIRTENLGKYVDYDTESIVICPKVECCRHYDAYMHTSFVLKDYVTSSFVPPLFIPDNFFDKKMKIRYGYDDYSKYHVNISPLKRLYSFESEKAGTDWGGVIEDLPFFWKNRIEILDINPAMRGIEAEDGFLEMNINNPWREKSPLIIYLNITYRIIRYTLIMPIFGNLYYKCRRILSIVKKKILLSH